MFVNNGYHKKFVDKAVGKQAKSRMQVKPKMDDEKVRTVRIPYVPGLSEEIRRLARKVEVRCVFYSSKTLRGLYNVKDCMPKEKLRNVVYSMKCGTCDNEYVGETQRALGVRKKEHCDAIRLGRVERSAVAEHVHAALEPHEIDWQSSKVIDKASWKRERKIRD